MANCNQLTPLSFKALTLPHITLVLCTFLLHCFDSELEESLLVLPFPYVIQLLELMRCFVESGYEIELSQRCLGFLLRYLSR